jgi:putative FmdB family regulatory protein
MPIYEYQAPYCLQSLFCSKRFSFWQNMSDPPVIDCPECGVPLERVMSTFSAAVDALAHGRAAANPPTGSLAPPATLKNVYGGGLGIQGCGHDCRTHHKTSPNKESS